MGSVCSLAHIAKRFRGRSSPPPRRGLAHRTAEASHARSIDLTACFSVVGPSKTANWSAQQAQNRHQSKKRYWACYRSRCSHPREIRNRRLAQWWQGVSPISVGKNPSWGIANFASSSCPDHFRSALSNLGFGAKPGVADRVLHESHAGAGISDGGSASTPARTSGNGCRLLDLQQGNRLAYPTSSTQRAVFHRQWQGVNPDASLSLFAVGDSGADVRHGRSGPGAFSGSADRPPGGFDGGRRASTAYRSRCCPDRSNCRSPPGSDNGHS